MIEVEEKEYTGAIVFNIGRLALLERRRRSSVLSRRVQYTTEERVLCVARISPVVGRLLCSVKGALARGS